MRYSIIKITLLVIIFVTLCVGQTITTQGVLRDGTGHSVADDTYRMTFRIYDALEEGTLEWESIQDIEVTNGIYNVILGSDSDPLDMLSGDGSYWLGVEVRSDGEMTPRLKLSLSPYEFARIEGLQNVFPDVGNVGIGTTNAPEKLTVNGNIMIPSAGGSIKNTSGNPVLVTGWTSTLGDYTAINSGYAWDASHEPISMIASYHGFFVTKKDAGGNPYSQRLFTVHNNGAMETEGAITINGGFDLNFRHDSDPGDIVFQSNSGSQWGRVWANNSTLMLSSDDITPDITIDSDGEVGIGTSAPAYKLDVNGQTRIVEHLVFNSNNGVINWGNDTNGGHLWFRTLNTQGANDDYNNLAILTNTGRLGLGTIGPLVDLHIKQSEVSGGLILDNHATNNYWQIYDNAYNDLVFHYSDGGHVWISRVTLQLYNSSDRALKKNISALPNVLSQVLALQPKEYHFKHSSDGEEKNIGFIAQDVEEVFPYLVEENEGTKGVAYSQFGVLAIAAIQEQQTIIDQQGNEIQDLKDRLTRIEASLGNK